MQRASIFFDDADGAAFVSSHVRSMATQSERVSYWQSLTQHLRSESATTEGRHGIEADVAAFDAKCIVQFVVNGDTSYELFLRHGS
jgi:hypothetical protein